MRKLSSNNGFSILEIMLAVIILGIVSSFAIPSYQNMVAQSRVSAAAIGITGECSVTRMKAISSKHKYKIVFTQNKDTCYYQILCDSNDSGVYNQVKKVVLSDEYRGITFNAPQITATFSTKGMLMPSEQKTIVLQQNKKQATVTISILGNAKTTTL